MRSVAIWSLLIVAVIVTSLAGFLALGTFLRAVEFCPAFNDCEDARNASMLLFGIAVVGAAIAALAYRGLGSPNARDEP
jgi:hypothetical protein